MFGLLSSDLVAADLQAQNLERTYSYDNLGLFVVTFGWKLPSLVSLGFFAQQLHQITQYTVSPSQQWINTDNHLLYLTVDFEGLQ